MCLSVCLTVSLSDCLSDCLTVFWASYCHLDTLFSIHVHADISKDVCVFVCVFLNVSVCISVWLSVCVSCASDCLFWDASSIPVLCILTFKKMCVCLYVCVCLCLSFWLSVSLFDCLYVYFEHLTVFFETLPLSLYILTFHIASHCNGFRDAKLCLRNVP